MNGKDLMQALNDIDERYIEEALPWSAAVKKERHPVWALAAGLACLLGSQLILFPVAFVFFVAAGLFALRPVTDGSPS